MLRWEAGYWLEVWLDGMEITSLPTFNMWGIDRRPVSIEIAYGWSDWLCISNKLRQSKIHWTDNITMEMLTSKERVSSDLQL